MARTVAIIQARMTSSRLPGKSMMDIAGIPMFVHAVRRAEAAGVCDAVVVATSVDPTDDPIANACSSMKIRCSRGSLTDVLERYHQAATEQKADVIVRLTADCPLLDPAIIKSVVEKFRTGQFDYASNIYERTFPKGLDTEVFSMEAFTRVREQAKDPYEREHVTPFFYRHPELFRIGSVTQDRNLSDLRWTVDTPEDMAFVRSVYERLGNTLFGQEQILGLLKA